MGFLEVDFLCLLGLISNFIALEANLKELKLSSTFTSSGLMVIIKERRLLPDREFYNIIVNLLSQNGMCLNLVGLFMLTELLSFLSKELSEKERS